MGLFHGAMRLISPLSICHVAVAVVIRFIINIIAIGVPLAGRRRATVGRFTIEKSFIGAIGVGPLAIRMLGVRPTTVWITGALRIPPVLERTVHPVIVRILVGMRGNMEVIGSFWPFLQDGPDGFVLRKRDGDPAVVVIYASPLSGVHVH